MMDLHPVFSQADIQHCKNTRKLDSSGYPQALNAAIDAATINQAIEVVSGWPGYQPTPLHALDSLAAEVGVASIQYKDESRRFGLGSFKALGGAYAVQCLLVAQLSRKFNRPVGFEELGNTEFKQAIREITVTTATDGNHGRSVAWGARKFGCRCVIYIHAQVSEHHENSHAVNWGPGH